MYSVSIQHMRMRLIPIIVCICLSSLAACNVHRPTSPLVATSRDNASAETAVYRAFIKNQLEDAFKTSCPHAVLDTTPLEPENKNPTQWFYLEPIKPSKELSERFLVVEHDRHRFITERNSFFIPVDDAVLKTMFSESCSIKDMQQLKCGWLQFKQLYGSSCGHWHFSHVAFNPEQNQALLRYDLHVYHWFENGWALMQKQNGRWHLTSVGVESIS